MTSNNEEKVGELDDEWRSEVGQVTPGASDDGDPTEQMKDMESRTAFMSSAAMIAGYLSPNQSGNLYINEHDLKKSGVRQMPEDDQEADEEPNKATFERKKMVKPARNLLTCKFPKCGCVLKWRKHVIWCKSRVIQHITTHLESPLLLCPLCDFKGRTVRQFNRLRLERDRGRARDLAPQVAAKRERPLLLPNDGGCILELLDPGTANSSCVCLIHVHVGVVHDFSHSMTSNMKQLMGELGRSQNSAAMIAGYLSPNQSGNLYINEHDLKKSGVRQMPEDDQEADEEPNKATFERKKMVKPARNLLTCKFPKCGCVLKWRKHVIWCKSRVIQHITTHLESPLLLCPLCDFKGRTVRQFNRLRLERDRGRARDLAPQVAAKRERPLLLPNDGGCILELLDPGTANSSCVCLIHVHVGVVHDFSRRRSTEVIFSREKPLKAKQRLIGCFFFVSQKSGVRQLPEDDQEADEEPNKATFERKKMVKPARNLLTCKFPKCGCVLKWRKHVIWCKSRVIQHITTHLESPLLLCPLCDFKGRTVRQFNRLRLERDRGRARDLAPQVAAKRERPLLLPNDGGCILELLDPGTANSSCVCLIHVHVGVVHDFSRRRSTEVIFSREKPLILFMSFGLGASFPFDVLHAEVVRYAKEAEVVRTEAKGQWKQVAESCVDGSDLEKYDSLVNHAFTHANAETQLESIGHRIGYALAERVAKESPKFGSQLEIVKFICKEFWSAAFGKQVDNLRTNHMGVYVVQDNKFTTLTSFSEGIQFVPESCKYVAMPCGMIRGGLAALGVDAIVTPTVESLPAVKFHIQIAQQ